MIEIPIPDHLNPPGLEPEIAERLSARWREDSDFRNQHLLIDTELKRRREGKAATRPAAAITPAGNKFLKPLCMYLDKRLPNQPCGQDLRECLYDGKKVSRLANCKDAERICETCPHHQLAPWHAMKSPRDRRDTWLGGVLQIMVTRACDRSCYGCTQGSNLAGKVEFMSTAQFRTACESLKGYFGVVGVFGGNPCLHPQFAELCKIMRETIPYKNRGLWSNHPKGKGAECRVTFNPEYSNLNVHESLEAHAEFAAAWPECKPYLKGLTNDSRHSPPFVAMKDVIPDEAERWKLIANCDINRNWSALIGVFRGELRGWFCEIAGSQSMLHQHNPDYPDTGVKIEPGWWNRGIENFTGQIKKHCHECGIPLKGHGALANTGPKEQCSATHAGIYKPKRPGREVEVVTELLQLGRPLNTVTNYIENGLVEEK